MTDHWEYYPCQIEDKTAFVFYDHGIGETIDDIGINTFLWLKLPLKTDKGGGLPEEAEFDQLNAVDDEIENFVEAHEGAYVGRVTAAGARFFHCYVNVEDEVVKTFVEAVLEKTGYQMEFLIEEDRNKDHYWEDLYPSDDDMQVMNDLRVMEVLEENGDDADKPRRINHWIYFGSEVTLGQYKDWAVAEGFEVDGSGPTEGENNPKRAYFLQIFNVERPKIDEVSETTAKLVQKAEELNGLYDGWETSVEAAQ